MKWSTIRSMVVQIQAKIVILPKVLLETQVKDNMSGLSYHTDTAANSNAHDSSCAVLMLVYASCTNKSLNVNPQLCSASRNLSDLRGRPLSNLPARLTDCFKILFRVTTQMFHQVTLKMSSKAKN